MGSEEWVSKIFTLGIEHWVQHNKTRQTLTDKSVKNNANEYLLGGHQQPLGKQHWYENLLSSGLSLGVPMSVTNVLWAHPGLSRSAESRTDTDRQIDAQNGIWFVRFAIIRDTIVGPVHCLHSTPFHLFFSILAFLLPAEHRTAHNVYHVMCRLTSWS